MYGTAKKKNHVRTLTSIRPKDYIVLIRVVPTLEKVEEKVFCLKVDVTSVRSRWYCGS
jgi:hypothetical protein